MTATTGYKAVNGNAGDLLAADLAVQSEPGCRRDDGDNGKSEYQKSDGTPETRPAPQSPAVNDDIGIHRMISRVKCVRRVVTTAGPVWTSSPRRR
jgi:hypothetical protein